MFDMIALAFQTDSTRVVSHIQKGLAGWISFSQSVIAAFRSRKDTINCCDTE